MEEAVELLVDIAIKAQDSELLTSCANSLQKLISSEFPLQAALVASIDLFLDSVRSELKKALESLAKVCNHRLSLMEGKLVTSLALGSKGHCDTNSQNQENTPLGL